MAILDAGEILAAIKRARPLRVVSVPEWGEGAEVRVAGFDAAGREWYLTKARALEGDADAAGDFAGQVLARQIVTPDGDPIFDAAEATQVGRMSPQVAGRLMAVVLELSGLLPAAVDTAEKNSASAPSSASSSDSPSSSE
jgi:hypothetical protein